MTREELRQLWETSYARHCELEAKYRRGEGLTRKDCLDIRTCNRRLRTVAFESWVQAGRPADPIFDSLRNPPPDRPFPWSPKPMDLTGRPEGGIN
jgi:hypothetical protein